PQRVSPAAHVHLLSPHCSVAPHAVAHAPQCDGSLVISTQEPPQVVRPALHAASQVPTLHTVTAPQALVHAPQFLGSVRRLTQAPLHDTSPGRVQGPLGPASRGAS